MGQLNGLFRIELWRMEHNRFKSEPLYFRERWEITFGGLDVKKLGHETHVMYNNNCEMDTKNLSS